MTLKDREQLLLYTLPFLGGRLFIMSLRYVASLPCTKFLQQNGRIKYWLLLFSFLLISPLCVCCCPLHRRKSLFQVINLLVFIFSLLVLVFLISSSLISLMISIAIVTKSFSFMDRLFITRIPIFNKRFGECS